MTFSLIDYGFTTRASDVQMIGLSGTFSTPHGGDMGLPGRRTGAIRCTLVRIFERAGGSRRVPSLIGHIVRPVGPTRPQRSLARFV
jgi:hypothetical protein